MKSEWLAYMYHITRYAWMMFNHLKLDILKNTPFINSGMQNHIMAIKNTGIKYRT